MTARRSSSRTAKPAPAPSFPSEHLSVAAAVYGAIAVLVVAHTRSRLLRALAVAAAVVLPAGVALSELHLGAHDPLDLLDQPLQRDRQVRAALGLRDGVDLVEDHPLGPLEDLARLRGQHQVERLRRGDEDVGRAAGQQPALLG